MRGPVPVPIISAMTRPTKSSKVLLVADRRATPAQAAGAPVRRYRLARLRLQSGSQGAESRFEYLKNLYD
jgi:transcriptional regulator of acetoin/glycerol metabolism